MAKIFVALIVALGLCLGTRGVISQTPCPTCLVDCTNTSLANHSLCLTSTTSACTPLGGPTVNTIDAATQTLLLNLHNDYRSLVRDGGEIRGAPGPQPAAGNGATTSSLPNLIWDPNLATVAQAWANQCKFSSDTLRNVAFTASPTAPIYVGQNAYARLDFASALPANSPFALQGFVRLALSTWYNEVGTFNSTNVASYKFNAANGKYSQLVWGATTAVGCGYVQWNFANNRIARILFCDYGPGGNGANKPVYTAANATNSP